MADNLADVVQHLRGETDEHRRAREEAAGREAERAAKREPGQDPEFLRHTRLH